MFIKICSKEESQEKISDRPDQLHFSMNEDDEWFPHFVLDSMVDIVYRK